MERARMLIALILSVFCAEGIRAQTILELSSVEAKRVFGIGQQQSRIPLSTTHTLDIEWSGASEISMIKIQISEKQRRALEKTIQNREAILQTELIEQQSIIEKKIAQLKAERSQMQRELLSSSEDSKGAIARKIYENILNASNLEAELNSQKKKLSDALVWKFEVDQIGGSRLVKNIHLGNELVWSLSSGEKTHSIASTLL